MICNQLRECITERKQCPCAGQCIISDDSRPIVSCQEKRKSYVLKNDTGCRVCNYHMDGGIVRDERNFAKCDNLLILYEFNEDKRTAAVFVELKGDHLDRALEQVSNSIRYFEKDLRKEKIYARIVHQKGIPNMRNSSKCIDLERLLRRHGGNLKLQERKLTEELSDLDTRK